MSDYKYGECSGCHKIAWLKDGMCSSCNSKLELPDFMQSLFGKSFQAE